MSHRWTIGTLAVLLLMTPRLAPAAMLESPRPHASVSGIGVIFGWKCDAGPLTVRFDGGVPLPLAYPNERADTASVCGDTDNGFATIMNWGNLAAGVHTAVVYDDGVEFGRSEFTVRRFREAFVRGAGLTLSVPDFPTQGDKAVFTWSQATQHLELADAFTAATSTDPPNCSDWPAAVTGKSAEWVKACVEAGADPNARNAEGDTPLHTRLHEHPDDIERALIRAGADPNLLDGEGQPHVCRTFECMAKKTYRRER